MELIGFLAALLVGVTLGIFGAGGSILTVPVLYYFFSIDAVVCTTYSLFIVGFTALLGAIPNIRKKLVSYKTVIIFSIPSLIAVYFTRAYLLPSIPNQIITIGQLIITKQIALLLFFAIIMLFSALSMIRQRKVADIPFNENEHFNYPLIIIEGFVVGILTGIVGAGGGFLIIPALVVLAKIPIKVAIGSSLLIIAIKSLFGFIADLQTDMIIDWPFLLLFTLVASIGILIGTYFSGDLNSQKMKGSFGWFVLCMAIYIIVSELFLEI